MATCLDRRTLTNQSDETSAQKDEGKVKEVLVWLVTSALAGGMVSCGGASRSRPHVPAIPGASGRSAVQGVASGRSKSGYLRSDEDGDLDDEGKAPSNDHEEETVAAGHGASPADRSTVADLVRRYYAAATAGDGAEGCALLAGDLDAAVAAGQQQHGASNACGGALSKLFEQQRQHFISEDAATMVVTDVRVNGAEGLATLGFRAMPESKIELRREHGTWKVDALFDSVLP